MSPFLTLSSTIDTFVDFTLSNARRFYSSIDLFHNGDQIQYSFVLMLISLTNLAAMHKIQKNIWNKVRLVSLININTGMTKQAAIYESGL